MNIITDLPPQLATFILAMLPVTELRASIPIGLEAFGLSVYQVFIYSILGNIIPAILIVYYLEPITKFLRKYTWADKFFNWLFARTRKKFTPGYNIWGKVALMFFVAIPLPVTGAWTGSIAAWLFGIEKKQAIIFIFAGVIIAGIVVSLISLGVFSAVDSISSP